jgi:two-component system, LuxR family, response regulator FixJ
MSLWNIASPQKAPFIAPPLQEHEPLVCVVDDDVACRRGLERLLRAAGLAVEVFAAGQDYLAREPHPGPHCLVLDIRLPDGRDGLRLQRILAEREEQIVFLTGYGDVESCAEAMKAGAVDFLLKPVDPEAFLAAVRIGLGRSGARIRRRLLVMEAKKRIATLTPREIEVMERVVAGMLNKQIAADLGAAEKTIKTHRGRVMHKTGCASVPELVHLAELVGMVGVD